MPLTARSACAQAVPARYNPGKVVIPEVASAVALRLRHVKGLVLRTSIESISRTSCRKHVALVALGAGCRGDHASVDRHANHPLAHHVGLRRLDVKQPCDQR
jgi:hypothetical protein